MLALRATTVQHVTGVLRGSNTCRILSWFFLTPNTLFSDRNWTLWQLFWTNPVGSYNKFIQNPSHNVHFQLQRVKQVSHSYGNPCKNPVNISYGKPSYYYTQTGKHWCNEWSFNNPPKTDRDISSSSSKITIAVGESTSKHERVVFNPVFFLAGAERRAKRVKKLPLTVVHNSFLLFRTQLKATSLLLWCGLKRWTFTKRWNCWSLQTGSKRRGFSREHLTRSTLQAQRTVTACTTRLPHCFVFVCV